MLNHHPLRFRLTNELHARPFTPLKAPARGAHLAFKQTDNAAERDPADDLAHLVAFLERHGGPRPADGAQHFSHDFGHFTLTWEQHTEFVSYTIYVAGEGDAPFDGTVAKLFPQDWLDAAPGVVIAASLLHIEHADNAESGAARLRQLAPFFNGESLTAAYICEEDGLIFGDFRIHEDGFSRFAILVCGELGEQRLGRAAQRVLELETYRSAAMLTLPVARKIARRLAEIDRQLSDLTSHFAEVGATAKLLDELTALSIEIEATLAKTAFRFGAAGAYAEIVDNRVEIMRETRVEGYQLFSEFMLRRFHPAMRTCRSTDHRLEDLAGRASRAADLLRTRINLSMQEQNQKLLSSMNKRAHLQLRLQETVEGLSIVAISYYAVSLASYILAPVGKHLGVDKTTLTAGLAIPVILGVWAMARRVRKRLQKSDQSGEDEAG